MFELNGFRFAASTASEGQNLFHHLRTPSGACFGRVQHLAALLAGQLIPQQLRHHENRSQHVIQVVGNPACHRSDALHSLRAEQLRLDLLLLGDVAVNQQNRLGPPQRIPQECPTAFDHVFPAILAVLAQFSLPLVLSD